MCVHVFFPFLNMFYIFITEIRITSEFYNTVYNTVYNIEYNCVYCNACTYTHNSFNEAIKMHNVYNIIYRKVINSTTTAKTIVKQMKILSSDYRLCYQFRKYY